MRRSIGILGTMWSLGVLGPSWINRIVDGCSFCWSYSQLVGLGWTDRRLWYVCGMYQWLAIPLHISMCDEPQVLEDTASSGSQTIQVNTPAIVFKVYTRENKNLGLQQPVLQDQRVATKLFITCENNSPWNESEQCNLCLGAFSIKVPLERFECILDLDLRNSSQFSL